MRSFECDEIWDSPWNNLNTAPELPERLRLDAKELRERGCMVLSDADIAFIGRSTVAQEITASPDFTLVHSTQPSKALDIMTKGLVVRSFRKQSLSLENSTVRLYSPTEANAPYADSWNTYALAYRYATNFDRGDTFDYSRSAKLVLQFPFSGERVPGIGKALAQDTPLEPAAPSRRFAEKLDRAVRIRPQFVKGFLDLDEQTFTQNPLFDKDYRRGLGKLLLR